MIIKVLLADCDGWKSEEREDGTKDVTNDLGEEEDVTEAHGQQLSFLIATKDSCLLQAEERRLLRKVLGNQAKRRKFSLKKKLKEI